MKRNAHSRNVLRIIATSLKKGVRVASHAFGFSNAKKETTKKKPCDIVAIDGNALDKAEGGYGVLTGAICYRPSPWIIRVAEYSVQKEDTWSGIAERNDKFDPENELNPLIVLLLVNGVSLEDIWSILGGRKTEVESVPLQEGRSIYVPVHVESRGWGNHGPGFLASVRRTRMP